MVAVVIVVGIICIGRIDIASCTHNACRFALS